MEEVEHTETFFVLPSPSPFSRFHGDPPLRETLRLSHLDTDRNLEVTVRTLRVYAGGHRPHDPDPFDTITQALSVALSSYYPLAGNLQRERPGDRLEVHCAEGKGVPVTRASSPRTLAYFNYFDDIGSPVVDGLVPDPKPGQELERPLMLQVTLFACGGFSLGMCVHHCLCDGAGGTLFLSSVAEIARGTTAPPVKPVWDRATLLGPRSPPVMEVDLSPFLHTEGRFSNPYKASDGDTVTFAREYFHVSDASLERLRAQIQEASGSSSFTSFEAVVAFIWRARINATGVPAGDKVKLVFSMDIRKLLKPCLPAGYWGNGCVPVYAQTTAGELVQRPLWEAAEIIRRSKRAVTEDYVRSYIDFQELHYCEGITAGKNVCGFTDWRHLNHSAANFGWGSPISVMPLSFKLLGCMDLSFLMPYPLVGGAKKGGFRCLVSIAKDAMPAFREEMKSLGEIESRVYTSKCSANAMC